MRVLIVKTSALGDIVQAFPIVEYLKSLRHVDYIGWVAEEQAVELLKSHPCIDEVIPIDSKAIRNKFRSLDVFAEVRRQRALLRQKKWDIVFDLQGNCKSACVTLMAQSKVKVGWGFQNAPEKISSLVLNYRVNPKSTLSMREQYLSIPRSYFHDETPFIPQPLVMQLTPELQELCHYESSRWPKDRPIWIVSLGSRWKNKTCDAGEMALALSALQKERNMYFVFTAATTQELNEAGTCLRKLPHPVPGNVLYQVPLPVVQYLMSVAERFIGVDSLMLHLASTTKTPTFSLFGASSSALYAPGHVGDCSQQCVCPSGMTFIKRCPNIRTCPSGACIKQVRAKQIESAIRRWIGGEK